MLERLNKSEEKIGEAKRESRQQVDAIQKKLTERERELEDKVQAYISLSHKQEELINENSNLNKDKTRLETEMNRIRRELETIIRENDELEKNNLER